MIRGYLDLFARMSKENRLILTSGNKVVYPSQGPCLIGPVVKKVIDGRQICFYQLALLDDSGGELLVPVDKAHAIGIRPLLNSSDIPKILSLLKEPPGADKDWQRRANDNFKLLSSGSAFDLAEVVKSLTKLSEKKALSFRESRTLEKARKLLIGEIAEVMGETKSAAEEQINEALNARETESS
jgi:CarD family transcriptional regulator, regulator of rRNA transcription